MHLDWTVPRKLISVGWRKQHQKRRRGCRRRAFGCFFLLILLAAGCGFLFWSVQLSQAAPLGQQPEPQPLAIHLLIDNSQSMFDLAGIGSDPELLRIDAARLFISYLGVDSDQTAHQCGIIFFGTTVDPVIPLTRLADDQRRAEMFSLIRNPPMMGWTDQALALETALQDFQSLPSSVQPVVVLLTDGKPQWNDAPSPRETEAYMNRLRQLGAETALANIPVFIILLANKATDADPDIAERWTPIWQDLASATQPGRFYVARQPEDLVDIYHDIVVALLGGRTAGPILQAAVGAAGLRQTVTVEPQLERLTLVVSKSNPALAVTILQPDGRPLSADSKDVRQAGGNGHTLEEIWVIDSPLSGDWTVLISGAGQVTVWKDYRPLPTATPQPTATPSHTPTPLSSATPTQTVSPTAVPTYIRPALTSTALPAQPIPPSPPRRRYELWLFGGLLVAGSGLGSYRYWRKKQPYIVGELHLLSGPGFVSEQAEVVLDSFRRQQLQLGMSGELRLINSKQLCSIRVGLPIGDTHEMMIQGDVLVNEQPILTECSLQDGDILTLGQTRLQYSNLRLHAAQQDALTHLNHTDPAF